MKTELVIPSDLKFLTVVEEWLLGALRAEIAAGNPDWQKIESRLRLVIVEVYSNVVRHAHQDRPELPVLMKVTLKENLLLLEIWDQGRGFNLRDYSPPVPGDCCEGGYGWLILYQLMDRVDYRLGIQGSLNCLILEKQLA